jgi:hypothetical protein
MPNLLTLLTNEWLEPKKQQNMVNVTKRNELRESLLRGMIAIALQMKDVLQGVMIFNATTKEGGMDPICASMIYDDLSKTLLERV